MHVYIYVCIYTYGCTHMHIYIYTCNPFIRLLKVLLIIKTPQPKSKIF